MKKDILSTIKEKRLYFDGGTGTVLQELGLPAGTPPEIWNIENPSKITELHKGYINAGANIIKTNTFGVNRDKYDNFEELIAAAMSCAKDAAEDNENIFIAFDMGPTGQLLKPLGNMEFEYAVELFAANIKLAEKYGADLILIETMNDSYETKAAVLAAKENSSLPVFVTNVYDESHKLMTGAEPKAMIAMLESMDVDALGMNCSLGPDKMLEILDEFCRYASVPIIVNPNAGLPVATGGKTVFNTSAEEFSEYMIKMADMGATVLGGCCGTTPEYIKFTVEKTKGLPYSVPEFKHHTLVSSYTHAVEIGKSPVLIGERINPTGKSKLKAALREDNMNYILSEAVSQEEVGVHILDVNVGLPEIDEKSMMKKTVEAVQAVTNIPLQIDSVSPNVLEAAMRVYNGKPLVNSVNGEEDKLLQILPLVKKYGGAVIALTIDENGIPETAEERVEIAKKIIDRAKEYGIDKKDIIVDPLVLTVSSNTKNALVTLEAVRLIHNMGICTSLGVSNISFGLPHREKINSVFFAQALENGLDCAIMNPFAKDMLDVYYAHRVLHNMDEACGEYIAYANSEADDTLKATPSVETDANKDLKHAVLKGMKDKAAKCAKTMLEAVKPLDIINGEIIPALNQIGADFEKKKAFLPQLLMSAEAASAAFEVVKEKLPKTEKDTKKAVVLATVKGDIHDIGKNIVKVMLESYGFRVYDLGRDVAPETVLECAMEKDCKLVGLSALMTTTVPAMEETIKLLHSKALSIKTVVGGAVLNAEYAKMINSDYYASDAMETVRIAENFYK